MGEIGWVGEDEVLSLDYAKFEMVLDIQGETLSKVAECGRSVPGEWLKSEIYI